MNNNTTYLLIVEWWLITLLDCCRNSKHRIPYATIIVLYAQTQPFWLLISAQSKCKQNAAVQHAIDHTIPVGAWSEAAFTLWKPTNERPRPLVKICPILGRNLRPQTKVPLHVEEAIKKATRTRAMLYPIQNRKSLIPLGTKIEYLMNIKKSIN